MIPKQMRSPMGHPSPTAVVSDKEMEIVFSFFSAGATLVSPLLFSFRNILFIFIQSDPIEW